MVRNPLRRQKKLIHHFRRCDPQKAMRGNTFDRLLLHYRTRDQLPMKVPQTENAAENLEFEQWPQASRVILKLETNSSSSSSMSVATLLESIFTFLGETMNTCPKPVEDCKVGPEDWARAELRTEPIVWFCELSDSPDGSEYAPSSNESDEDDFDYGAFC